MQIETNLTEKDYEILNAMVNLYPIDVESKDAIAKAIKVISEQQEEIENLKHKVLDLENWIDNGGYKTQSEAVKNSFGIANDGGKE